MLQPKGDQLFRILVLELKCPFSAETDRGDDAIQLQIFLPVTMPCHPLLTGGIQVQQTGIEPILADGSKFLPNLCQRVDPSQGGFGRPGIAVTIRPIRIPGDLPSGNDGFAKDNRLITTPRNVLIKLHGQRRSFVRCKNPPEIFNMPIFWQQVTADHGLITKEIRHGARVQASRFCRICAASS